MPFKMFESQSTSEPVLNDFSTANPKPEALNEIPEQQAVSQVPTFPIMALSDIAGYEAKPSSDVIRHGIRTAARVGETLAGLPGDLVQLAGTLINMGTRAITGEESPVLGNIPYLPTSSRLREYITTPIAETLAGKGYLDPKSKGESIADDVVSDVAAFMFPIKGKIPFARALKTAGLGNVAKFAAEKIGLPEEWQEAIKAGTMIGYNFVGPKKLKAAASASREAAQSALPETAEYSVKKLSPALNKLEQLRRSGDLPVRWEKKMASILDDVAGDKIRVQTVWDLSQDLNNAFYNEKPPAAFNRAFKPIKESIYGFMEDYGKTNPAFYTNWLDSNSMFSSLAKAEDLTKFLDKNLSKSKIGLATLGSLLGFYAPTTALKYGGGAYIGKEMFKTFHTLSKSPAARKYWLKTMGQAAKGNIKQMNAFAGKLDKELAAAMEKEKPKSQQGRYALVYPS